MKVIYSQIANNKLQNIQNIMGYLELAGPIFGRFDIQNGENILIVEDMFERTVSRGVNHSDFAFNAENDYEIQQVINTGNNWIGSWHTHTPWSFAEKDGVKTPIGLNFSEKDMESYEELHKQIGIKKTIWLLITKNQVGYILKGE